MIEELQIRVSPKVAYYNDEIVHFIASERHISHTRIKGVRILKRSIDARKQRVMVNLKVRAYIDEPVNNSHLIPPIEYKKVDGTRQAIVVGAGPGGLFAALRLIELGIKPILLERGKMWLTVVWILLKYLARALSTLTATTVLAKAELAHIAMVSYTPEAKSVALWIGFWVSCTSMEHQKIF